VICVAICGFSLGTAALGAAAQLSAAVAGWASQHSGLLAPAIVAIVAAGLLAGLAMVRRTASRTLG
jgi:hypothetical protein